MKYIFYFIIFLITGTLNSQTAQKLKFQKNTSLIYFFPKSITADSVIKSTNNLFYFVVPDSLKKHITIYVENAKLLKTGNDSIVKLNYMPGLKYESLFIIKELPPAAGSKNFTKVFDLISLINGPSSYQKNKMLIQIINKKEEKVLVENVFIYSE